MNGRRKRKQQADSDGDAVTCCLLMRAASTLLRRSFGLSGTPQTRHNVRQLSLDSWKDHTAVHFVGDDRYGSREYVLLPIQLSLDDLKVDPKLKLASIHAHRNIVFGARVLQQEWGSTLDLCGPLLDAALEDASEQGEQPQALSSLVGLCSWVSQCIRDEEESNALSELKTSDNDVVYEAVKSIATGVPRPGHTVVGVGTFRDGKPGWEKLAMEFAHRELSDEVRLYQSRGGEVVGIEHLADQSDEYLESAGGAMARFFFL